MPGVITYIMEFLVEHARFLTPACIVATALAVAVWQGFTQPKIQLESVLLAAFSASMAPTGVALMVAAFEPRLIWTIPEFSVYFAIAGVVVVFVAVKGVMTPFRGKRQRRRQSPSKARCPPKETKDAVPDPAEIQ